MAKKSIAQLKVEGYDVRFNANNYHPAEASLNDGNSISIDLSSLDTITSVEITNDTTGRDLLVSINGGANFSVIGDSEKVIDKIEIESITLTNSSGGAINYKILAWGF